MQLNTKLAQNEQGTRLFALYEAFSAKEIAVTCQLLYPASRLPHETYLKLEDALRIIRTECNDYRLAIGAHRKKMLELAVH